MERTTAVVTTEISLHQLINGLEQLAETYPTERLAPEQIERIVAVSRDLLERLKVSKDRRVGPKNRRFFSILGMDPSQAKRFFHSTKKDLSKYSTGRRHDDENWWKEFPRGTKEEYEQLRSNRGR